MAFDIDRFLRDAPLLTAPTKKVRVPELKHWFPEGEEPDWEVRGLTGDEIARANDVNSRIEVLRDAMEVIASAVRSNRGEALKEIMGLSDVPNDLARHFDHLMYGSVNPQISREAAVWIFKLYPVQAKSLIMEIMFLTNNGPDLGKLQDSTVTPDIIYALHLCERKNRFLFEVRPDIFPGGRLCAVELKLWDMFIADLNESRQK